MRVSEDAIAFKPPILRGHIAWDWIPKSAVLECDTDIDQIEAGEEITVEIPLWLAQKKGLTE